MQVKDFKVEIHGIDHHQYYQGASATYTDYDEVFVGVGSDFSEALEDALENAAQWRNIMAIEIASHDYWNEVESTAKNCVEDAIEFDADLYDTVWELVDGHSWVIYYAYNLAILKNSDNPSALFEEMGPQSFDDHLDALQKMAFFAFYQDVMKKAQEFYEEWEEEQDEEEE